MTKSGTPRPVARIPLNRERVLAAAIAVADADGLESLSMRRLAQELGVEAMSLYHHVPGRRALLSGMLDEVFGQMELPHADGSWKLALRATALSAHRVLLRHAWACGLIGAPLEVSPSQLRWMDAVLARLRRAGFSAEMTHHAYHALDSHIVGFTMWALPYLALAREQPDFASRFLAETATQNLPYLAEHVGVHLAGRPDDTSEFDFGLDLILDGLERILASS